MARIFSVHKQVISMVATLAVGAAGLITASQLGGCAPESSSKKTRIVKECVLPEDQTGTLSGRWKAQPIPISFKQGSAGWDADEEDAIMDAADIWNKFYEASLGIKVLDYGDRANPNRSTVNKPTNICATGIISNTTFTGQVVMYRQGSWPYTNHDAIALTTFCPMPAKPIPNIFMGLMEANYQDFFVEGKKQPDLKSIFIHEFGHLLGLDHSCNTATKSGFPNCNDSDLPDDYLQAVMFPVILFDQSGFGENRHSLTDNDMGRANCLYKDMVAPK